MRTKALQLALMLELPKIAALLQLIRLLRMFNPLGSLRWPTRGSGSCMKSGNHNR